MSQKRDTRHLEKEAGGCINKEALDYSIPTTRQAGPQRLPYLKALT